MKCATVGRFPNTTTFYFASLSFKLRRTKHTHTTVLSHQKRITTSVSFQSRQRSEVFSQDLIEEKKIKFYSEKLKEKEFSSEKK